MEIFEKRIERCKLALKLGFTYCRESGNVISPTKKIVSKSTKNGYLMMCLRDTDSVMQYLLCHQFAWYCEFKEAVKCLDHINRDKKDNRIINLRSVNKSENASNIKNVRGYTYCSRSKKYIAIIMVNYKKKQLGTFENPEDAAKCYLENKHKYHLIN